MLLTTGLLMEQSNGRRRPRRVDAMSVQNTHERKGNKFNVYQRHHVHYIVRDSLLQKS